MILLLSSELDSLPELFTSLLSLELRSHWESLLHWVQLRLVVLSRDIMTDATLKY